MYIVLMFCCQSIKSTRCINLQILNNNKMYTHTPTLPNAISGSIDYQMSFITISPHLLSKNICKKSFMHITPIETMIITSSLFEL